MRRISTPISPPWLLQVCRICDFRPKNESVCFPVPYLLPAKMMGRIYDFRFLNVETKSQHFPLLSPVAFLALSSFCPRGNYHLPLYLQIAQYFSYLDSRSCFFRSVLLIMMLYITPLRLNKLRLTNIQSCVALHTCFGTSHDYIHVRFLYPSPAPACRYLEGVKWSEFHLFRIFWLVVIHTVKGFRTSQ